MRIMGLDFGSKTTGVAVSDPLGITAQGIETITRKDENKLRQTCARIEELIREAYPDVPLMIGGVEASLRRFADYLYNFKMHIIKTYKILKI